MGWRQVRTSAVPMGFGAVMLVVGVPVLGMGVTVLVSRDAAFAWVVAALAAGAAYIGLARQACFDLIDGQTVELPLHGAMRGESRPWRMPDILSAAVHQMRNREQTPS